MRHVVLAGLALALLLGPRVASAQGTPPSLTGQLVDATTRLPIRAALVELAKENRRVLTDSLGRFTFPKVAARTHVVIGSALGYAPASAPAEPGSPLLLLLSPQAVPLASIQALVRPASRTVHGATAKVFGREDLLAAGDIPVAQFVNWKAHFQTRLCRLPDPGIDSMLTLPLASDDPTKSRANGFTSIGASQMGSGSGSALGGTVTQCIVGAGGRMGPFVVMLDEQPLTSPDELWSHHSWDLGRVDVVYQRSGIDAPFGSPFARPFAFVHLYTNAYLSRVAGRVQHVCDHIASFDTINNPLLGALCGP